MMMILVNLHACVMHKYIHHVSARMVHVKEALGIKYVSYSTVVLYSRDRYEIIGLSKISYSIKQPCGSICLKRVSNASKLLKQRSTLAKQSGKSNILIYSKLLKIQASPKFRLANCRTDGLPASQTACRKTRFH